MKTQNIIFLLIILLLFGCSSVRKAMIQTGENIQETAIHNAILDFSTNCSLYKKDSIFEVSFQDTLYTYALKQVDERNFSWERDKLYEDIVTVGISAHRICVECEEYGLKFNDRFLYTAETTVGSKGKLPSRHIIKDGKLFFWWDDDYPLTEEMFAILWKYDLLFDDTEGLVGFPQFSTGKQKGATYYFCRNDLSKYKRVVTNVGLGYYKPCARRSVRATSK